MKKFIFLAIAASLFAAISLLPTKSAAQNSVAQDIDINKSPNISISANAYRLVSPNKIEISVSLRESDNRRVTLASLERDLINALKSLDIDPEKSLKVTDQSSAFRRRSDVNQYKDFMVTVENAATVAAVFDKLSEAGISNATVVNATRTDLDQIADELKVEAIMKAQKTARALAESIGQSIGKAIEISMWGRTVIAGLRMDSKLNYAESGAEPIPEVEFKEIRIEQDISVKFILE